WHTCPGLEADGTVNDAKLRAWVSDARHLLEEADRLSVGDDEIGQALAAAPADPDGLWPCLPVRDLVEELANEHIDAGFARRIFNNRGATSRSLTAGGAQEWSLVAQYRERAQRLRVEWPRVATIFESLAETYERDARREDA